MKRDEPHPFDIHISGAATPEQVKALSAAIDKAIGEFQKSDKGDPFPVMVEVKHTPTP